MVSAFEALPRKTSSLCCPLEPLTQSELVGSADPQALRASFSVLRQYRWKQIHGPDQVETKRALQFSQPSTSLDQLQNS